MRAVLIRSLALVLLVSLALPLAFAKKKKKFDVKARLKSIETVYVEGYSRSADYIRQNLSNETCLKYMPNQANADAVLEVREEVGPCSDRMARSCQAISGKLYDRETKKLLWFREDDTLPVSIPLGGMDKRAQWLLWNLENACCKGRSSPPPPPSEP
jgi:hypothetical protein